MRTSVKWLIFAFISIVCLVLVVSAPLEHWLVRLYLQSSVEKGLGTTITWKDIRTDDASLIWEGIQIGAVGQLAEATIDEVRISYVLDLWKRQLSARVEVIRPKVILSRNQCLQEPPPYSDALQTLGVVEAVRVVDGVIGWSDAGMGDSTASFSSDMTRSAVGAVGSATLSLGRSQDLGVKLSLSPKDNGRVLTARFQAMPADLAMALVRTFSRAYLPLRVHRGTMTGQLMLPLSGFHEAAQGQLALSDVGMSIDGTLVSISSKDMRLTLASPIRHGDRMLLHIQGNCALDERLPNRSEHWGLEGMRGQLALGYDDTLQMSLRGQWWYGEQVKAFRLDVTSSGLHAMKALAAFTNQDGSEGKLEFASDRIMGMSAVATKLGHAEATLLASLLRRQIHALSTFRLTRGTLDANIVAEQGTYRLKNLRLSDFEVLHPQSPMHLQGYMLSGDMLVSASQLETARFNLEGGALRKNNEVPWSTSIRAAYQISDGTLEQASFSGCLGNRQGFWSVERQQNAWTMKGQCSGDYLTDMLALKIGLGPAPVSWHAELTDATSIKGQFVAAGGQLDFAAQLVSEPLKYLGMGACFPEALLKCVGSGSFQTTQFPVDLFTKLPMRPEGSWRASGSFGNGCLLTTVNLHQLALSDERWRIEAPKDMPILATIKTSFEDGDTQFSCPVKAFSFTDKPKQLAFHDVSGDLRYYSGELHLSRAEASCEGIVFHGEIEAPADKQSCHLVINGAHGTVAQLKKLLTKLDQASGPLEKLPLDGRFDMGESSADLILTVGQDSIACRGVAKGEISDASLSLGLPDIAVRELGLRFTCVLPEQSVAVDELQGTVLIGRPGHRLEEYRVSSDGIRFAHYPVGDIVFDLWIGDKRRDVVRLAGQASPEKIQNLQVRFDTALTHFGNVHPKKFWVGLTDWTVINTLNLEMAFELSSILRDLQRLGQVGLSSSLKQMIEEFLALKSAQGRFVLSADYDRETPKFSYLLRGEDVAFDERKFQKIALKGSVRHNNWMVDQLSIDDVSIAADVLHLPERWKVNFLGVRCGRALTLGLEGNYFQDKGAFEGHVNLLDVHLQQLQNWKPAHKFVEQFLPKGEVRAQGPIVLTHLSAPDWFDAKIDLHAQLRSVELAGLRLRDTPRLAMRYTSQQGWVVENLSTALVSARHTNRNIPIEIRRIAYNNPNHRFAIEGGNFQLPKGSLGWLPDLFKSSVGPVAHSILQKCCQQADTLQTINGRFSCDCVADSRKFSLEVDEGTVRLAGHTYNCRQFAAHINPHELIMNCRYEIGRSPIWVLIRSQCPITPYGQIVLSDQPIVQGVPKAPQSMALGWRFRDGAGFDIERVVGSLYGLQANLSSHVSDPHTLMGTIKGSIKPLLKFLPERWETLFTKWKADADYMANGAWRWSSAGGVAMAFDGHVTSDRIEAGGYRVRSAQAHVHYAGHRLDIQQVQAQEGEAKLTVPEIAFERDSEGLWKFSIPSVTITDLVPSSLRLAHNKQKKQQEMSFPSISLENFGGSLNDPKTFVGEGSARFHYAKKSRRAGKGLLGMTVDLMSRVGFDWDVITPTGGIVEYQLADEKLVITKLKDVYSQGKLAKYSLAKEGNRSTIGFDGKLDLLLRLKPAQSFLKVTDKLMLSITGTVHKPECCLEQ